MKIQITLFALILVLISSCGTAASRYYTPTEANAAKANMPVENLIAGKDLYITACKECHRLNKPSRYDAQEWTSILEKMQKKAKLSDAETAKIYAYLTSEIQE